MGYSYGSYGSPYTTDPSVTGDTNYFTGGRLVTSYGGLTSPGSYKTSGNYGSYYGSNSSFTGDTSFFYTTASQYGSSGSSYYGGGGSSTYAGYGSASA